MEQHDLIYVLRFYFLDNFENELEKGQNDKQKEE